MLQVPSSLAYYLNISFSACPKIIFVKNLFCCWNILKFFTKSSGSKTLQLIRNKQAEFYCLTLFRTEKNPVEVKERLIGWIFKSSTS